MSILVNKPEKGSSTYSEWNVASVTSTYRASTSKRKVSPLKFSKWVKPDSRYGTLIAVSASTDAEKWAWETQDVPRWNDYRVKLSKYESTYKVDSETLLRAYEDNSISDIDIPIDQNELTNWLKTYKFYSR